MIETELIKTFHMQANRIRILSHIFGLAAAGATLTLYIATTEDTNIPVIISSLGSNLIITWQFGYAAFDGFFDKEKRDHLTPAQKAGGIICAILFSLPPAIITAGEKSGGLPLKLLFAALNFLGNFPLNFSIANLPREIRLLAQNTFLSTVFSSEGKRIKAEVLSNIAIWKEQLSLINPEKFQEAAIGPLLVLLKENYVPQITCTQRLSNSLPGKALLKIVTWGKNLLTAGSGLLLAFCGSGYPCATTDSLMRLFGIPEEYKNLILTFAHITFLAMYYLSVKGGIYAAEMLLNRLARLLEHGRILANQDKVGGRFLGVFLNLLSISIASLLSSLSGYTAGFVYSSCPIQPLPASMISGMAAAFNAIWVTTTLIGAKEGVAAWKGNIFLKMQETLLQFEAEVRETPPTQIEDLLKGKGLDRKMLQRPDSENASLLASP